MQVLQASGDDCKLFMSSAEGIMYIPRSWTAVRRGGLLIQRTGPSMECVILSIFHLVSFSPPFFLRSCRCFSSSRRLLLYIQFTSTYVQDVH